MGWTSASETPPVVGELKAHVQHLESYLEEALEFLLPHVDAILSELERRLPPEATASASSTEAIHPSNQSTHQQPFSVKKEKSKKTRSSISAGNSRARSKSRKRAEPNPTPVSTTERNCSLYTQSDVIPCGVPYKSPTTQQSSACTLGSKNCSSTYYTSSYVSSENSYTENHPPKLSESSSNPHSFSFGDFGDKKRASPEHIRLPQSSSRPYKNSPIPTTVNPPAVISVPNEFHAISQRIAPVPAVSGPIPDSSLSTRGAAGLASAHSSVSCRVTTRTSVAVTAAATSNASNKRPVSTVTSLSNLPARGTAPSDATGASPGDASAAERLLSAAKSGAVEAVLLALEAGTPVSGRDDSGKTALHLAAWKGHADVVALLLTSGADPSDCANAGAYTPLHVASFAGHAQCVAFLLDAGVAVDCTSKNGSTALHMAALNGYETIVQLLVAAGASREIKDDSGKTAYDMSEAGAIWELLLL